MSSAAQRTNEIGARGALGAARYDVVGLVLRNGLWMAAAGIAIGIGAAHVLRGVVARFLYGAPSTDVASYASAAFLLLVLTAAAIFLPAWRAGSLDPLAALRQE